MCEYLPSELDMHACPLIDSINFEDNIKSTFANGTSNIDEI